MYITIQQVEVFEKTDWSVQALVMMTELGETEVKLEVDDEWAHLIYAIVKGLLSTLGRGQVIEDLSDQRRYLYKSLNNVVLLSIKGLLSTLGRGQVVEDLSDQRRYLYKSLNNVVLLSSKQVAYAKSVR
ncbi:hypothetical protein BDB01DRAFT_895508 [Pilobolus umbonatus]|nr:hypothetical protein BDB01DRAFT_895506 [Pilobolus umbonatus]KAI8988755.1 hypothetical protein BDB01DRAFT_895508 [Pilobolus umbonatus]